MIYCVFVLCAKMNLINEELSQDGFSKDLKLATANLRQRRENNARQRA